MLCCLLTSITCLFLDLASANFFHTPHENVCLSLWLPSLRAAVGGMLQVRVVCTMLGCLNLGFGGEQNL